VEEEVVTLTVKALSDFSLAKRKKYRLSEMSKTASNPLLE